MYSRGEICHLCILTILLVQFVKLFVDCLLMFRLADSTSRLAPFTVIQYKWYIHLLVIYANQNLLLKRSYFVGGYYNSVQSIQYISQLQPSYTVLIPLRYVWPNSEGKFFHFLGTNFFHTHRTAMGIKMAVASPTIFM